MKLYLSILIFSYTFIISAQSLKLEDIMKGDEFIGQQPTGHKWSPDGETIYFNWNPSNALGSSPFFWKEGMEKPALLPDDQKFLMDIPSDDQKDQETVYYIKSGSIYSFDRKSNTSKKVFVTSERLSGLIRGVDPDILFFRKEDNLYKFNIREASLIQITNLKKSKKTEKPAKENFLSNQQKELFAFIREKDAQKDWTDKRIAENKDFFPKEYNYDPLNLNFLTPSPDGKYVCFGLSESPEPKPTRVEQFITSDGFTNSENAREKVSINNLGKYKYGIYSTEMDSFYTLDFSGLTGIKELPEYYKEYSQLKDKEKTAKMVRSGQPIFNKSGSLVVMDLKSLDNKDRWLVSLDLMSGKITELDHQHDEAWIGGPGVGFFRGILGFLPDDHTLYFQSEESGFSHLYSLDVLTGHKKALTTGKWEVRDVSLSNDGNSFYLTTNTTHPGNREFYKLDIVSGTMTGILMHDGAHEVVLSPDETKLLVRYSYKNKPWDLYTAENKPDAALRQITYSTTEAFNKYAWRKPEVVTFAATDGQKVYARIYEPAKGKKNKAAIIFVHGAGYLQNAHNHWSSYMREYMFNNLMADKGYTILDIDYRGSDGYGRDVRTGIYRHMGGLDLSDQLDGIKYLVDKYGIDPKRVGMYGGSYGGFITLMALLTKPGTIKAGAGLRSVTDWAHYNHGYTSNILNFPETDSIAYRRSSPIYFAENLQDKLLMLHGMVDDNVQFQDIVRLTQRFIELGKKGWDLAVFPVESHGFVKSYSWTDEYRRIMDLFDKELKK